MLTLATCRVSFIPASCSMCSCSFSLREILEAAHAYPRCVPGSPPYPPVVQCVHVLFLEERYLKQPMLTLATCRGLLQDRQLCNVRMFYFSKSYLKEHMLTLATCWGLLHTSQLFNVCMFYFPKRDF